MNSIISSEDLEEFGKNFRENKNEELQNRLKDNPLLDVCLNAQARDENKFEFNVELEECRRYTQAKSLRCWLFATLNFIKNDIAHNLGQSTMDFEFSANFLNFYDKLEKANHAYQMMIDLDVDLNSFRMCDYETHPILTGYLKSPVRENGKINYAVSLLKKYGIVPSSAMPETYNSSNSDDFNNLFMRKVKFDMLEILRLRKENGDVYSAKKQMLSECYSMLAHVLGEPPKTFDYTYNNENGEAVKIEGITPLEFYRSYCKINFDDYIQLANYPIFEYYKKFKRRFTQDIVEGEEYKFVNIPLSEFSELCVRQLQAGIPVPIACENRKYRDSESKILDTRNFDFEKLFGYRDMTKEQSLSAFDTRSRHVMVVRGVHLEDGKPVRWKVEDSYGDDARINGYYVMNNNYFEKCVFFALINKKFVSDKIIEASKLEPVEYGFEGGEI